MLADSSARASGSDEILPDTEGFPNLAEIAGQRLGRLVQDVAAVTEDEGRNTHVGRAMYEYGLRAHVLHRIAELQEIFFSRLLEIDGDVNVFDSQGIQKFSFVGQCILGVMGSEVDYMQIPRLLDAPDCASVGCPLVRSDSLMGR